MNKRLYLLKLGGSVITHTNRKSAAKISEIDRLLKEVDDARTKGGFDIIIGHGSGSFGHIPAKKYNVKAGLVNKHSRRGSVITMSEAARLNNIVVSRATRLGIPVFPFSAHSFGTSSGGNLSATFIDGIKAAMDQGFIPLVYGDVVIDKKRGVSIASTEDILHSLSKKMKPSMVIIGTDVNGIFDKNPMVFSDAKLIRKVTSKNLSKVLGFAGDSVKRANVTGGMHSKLLTLYSMVNRKGSVGFIANASKPNVIKNLLLNQRGSAEFTSVSME